MGATQGGKKHSDSSPVTESKNHCPEQGEPGRQGFISLYEDQIKLKNICGVNHPLRWKRGGPLKKNKIKNV